MKRSKIGVLFLVIILVLTTFVFATEPQISIEGDVVAAPGATKELKVKINSNDIELGVVSGKIEKENVANMTITALNGWNITYNNETGDFNIVKAEGAKVEEIIKIEYTLPNEEGTAKITMSDVILTTIEYEQTEAGSISKEISIVNNGQQPEEPEEPENPGQPEEPDDTEVVLTGIKITKAPTKTKYKVGEKFDKAGMVITAEYSDGTSKEVTNYTYSPSRELKQTDKKVTITYTEGEVTKTIDQSITMVAGEAKGELPNTGIENYFIVIISVAAVGLVSYIGYKKYNNIYF